jgi:hypothetical protein
MEDPVLYFGKLLNQLLEFIDENGGYLVHGVRMGMHSRNCLDSVPQAQDAAPGTGLGTNARNCRDHARLSWDVF